MPDELRDDLIATAHAWDRAMVTNDADAIGAYMADDWIIVGPDARSTGKEAFLALVRSGDLSHDTMESTDVDVRVYGETAVLLANGVSAGRWKGHRFREVERSSNVFVRQEGRWRCVLTHLSRIPDE